MASFALLQTLSASAIGLAVLFCLWLLSKSKGNGRLRLPPGPTPLPIIGNLHMLGKLPHRTLQNMAKKYGPIIYLRLGSVPTVVASSPEMAKEILKTHDAIFSSRPITSAGKYTASNYSDLAFAPYGPYWRHMRKVCMLELLTTKRIESFRPMREEEVGLMIDSIWEESGHGAKPVDLSKKIKTLTYDVMCRMLTSRKYAEDEMAGKEFLALVQELLICNGSFNIGDFIPSLDWLDLQGIRRRMIKVRERFDVFAEKVIDEHVERLKKLNAGENVQRRQKDFVDVLLELTESNSTSELKVTRENIISIIFDMFVAGMDTSATVLEWGMTELMRNPHVMKKAHEELDSVVGKERRIKVEDLPSLDYLLCVVKEMLRMYPPGPLLVPHSSMEPATVGGYHIPNQSRVIVNVWAIGRDPALWENPDAFKPERFMDSSIDIRGQHFELLPFGSGRRGCPATSLAMEMLQLAIGQMLQCYEWTVEGNASDIDMNEDFGVTIPRLYPLYAIPHPRLSSNALI